MTGKRSDDVPDDDDGQTDDDLLERSAAGDRAAFAHLMARHAQPMLSLAQRVTGSCDDAEELVQDAFLKVWTHAAKWRRGGAAHFSTWLYRVVLNGCLDRRRRPLWTGLDSIGDLAYSGSDAPHAASQRQSRDLIMATMNTLPQRQRAALVLHYFSELSAPQAARVLDTSIAAMEALLIRGKRALKTELARRGIADFNDLL